MARARGSRTEAHWLAPAEERAWRAYRRMNRLLYAHLAQDLTRDSGLSDADYEVLSNLTESPTRRWRFNALAGRLRWSSSRLSHQLTRMERRGLLRRDDCDDDARGAMINLSPAGWRAIVRAAPEHVESVRRHFIGRLSRSQIKALTDIASTVLHHLEA